MTAEAKRNYGRTLLRQYAPITPKNTLIYRNLKNILGDESLIGKQQKVVRTAPTQEDKNDQTTVKLVLKHSKELPPIKWGDEQKIQLGYDEVDACVDVFPDRKVLWMLPVPAGDSEKEQLIRETLAGDKQVILRGISYYVFSDEGGFAGACKAYRLGNVLNIMAVPQTDYSFVGEVSELSASDLSLQSTRELQLKEIIPIKMENNSETSLTPFCSIRYYKGKETMPDLIWIQHRHSNSYELVHVVDTPGEGRVLAKDTKLGFISDDGYRFVLDRDHTGVIEAQIEKSVTEPKTAIGALSSEIKENKFYPIGEQRWVHDIGGGYKLFLRGLASPQKDEEGTIISGKFMYILRKISNPCYERNIDLGFTPGRVDELTLNLGGAINVLISPCLYGTRIVVG